MCPRQPFLFKMKAAVSPPLLCSGVMDVCLPARVKVADRQTDTVPLAPDYWLVIIV